MRRFAGLWEDVASKLREGIGGADLEPMTESGRKPCFLMDVGRGCPKAHTLAQHTLQIGDRCCHYRLKELRYGETDAVPP